MAEARLETPPPVSEGMVTPWLCLVVRHASEGEDHMFEINILIYFDILIQRKKLKSYYLVRWFDLFVRLTQTHFIFYLFLVFCHRLKMVEWWILISWSESKRISSKKLKLIQVWMVYLVVGGLVMFHVAFFSQICRVVRGRCKTSIHYAQLLRTTLHSLCLIFESTLIGYRWQHWMWLAQQETPLKHYLSGQSS